mmetsp:Transcript_1696/g.2648  ORF Transcript_1696/g.2648 Transcript_1696/m.2648 type:complete len:81 (+) Transcript_1696:55-297(+)
MVSPSGVKKQSPNMSSRLRVAGVPRVETAAAARAERPGTASLLVVVCWSAVGAKRGGRTGTDVVSDAMIFFYLKDLISCV